MISSQALLDSIRKGRDIRVRQTSAGSRMIHICAFRGGDSWAVELPFAAYEALMRETVLALAERHGSDLRVALKMDHFGSRWAEVSSGLLRHRVSRLGLSPRHLYVLEHAIAARSMAAA